jgi:putative AdoMet-dependent methyltransferase
VEVNQFPAGEFDAWAKSYDQDVLADTCFPFDGYGRVLDTLVNLAAVQPGMRVLDLGTGTANLALRFASLGCKLWCSDFSTPMLEKARGKLPQAVFVQADLRAGWPEELDGSFERIVSGYVFHHFPLDQKIALSAQMVSHLAPGGRILIADVAFMDTENMQAMRQALGEAWEDEYYWVAAETLPALKRAGMQASYRQISSCGGVFIISLIKSTR